MAQKTKKDLLAEAKAKGVNASEDQTVPEIEAAIAEADAQDNPATPAEQRGDTGSALTAAAVTPDAPDAPAPGSAQARDQVGAGVAEFTTVDEDRGVVNIVNPEGATEAEQRRAALEIGSSLATLPHSVLAKLRSALDQTIAGKGHEPEKPVESELSKAQSLPYNIQLSTELTAEKAVAVVNDDPQLEGRELTAEDLAPGGYSVRQATNLGHLGGNPVGPAYVIAVTAEGKKFCGRLTTEKAAA